MVLGTRSILLNLNILIFFRHNRQRSISRKLETRWHLCDFWTLTRCCCQCFHMFQLCPSAIWLLNYHCSLTTFVIYLGGWIDRKDRCERLLGLRRSRSVSARILQTSLKPVWGVGARAALFLVEPKSAPAPHTKHAIIHTLNFANIKRHCIQIFFFSFVIFDKSRLVLRLVIIL